MMFIDPYTTSKTDDTIMEITYRQGTLADAFAAFAVFEKSVNDLGTRLGSSAITGADGHSSELQELWDRRRPLMEHLTRTATHFWLAERDSQIIGYARAMMRDKVFQLTDFFVLPGHQSEGVGRELIARTFPHNSADHRIVIATIDQRAQVRYLKQKVYPRFPIYYWSRPARLDAQRPTDLSFILMNGSRELYLALNTIDRVILGYRREEDHHWLGNTRQGYLYLRDGHPVGYGYTGSSAGPFALLDPKDFPAVLAHAESIAADYGEREFGVETSMINHHAVDYLLDNDFEMSAFFELFMSDAPFGRFDQYIFTSPPFFC